MPVEGLLRYFLNGVFFGFLGVGPLLPVCWYLLAVVYPQKLLDRFIVEPQFTRAETRRFRHYPGTMVAAGFTMWIMCFPKLMGKRRKMTDIREHSPRWFRYACYFTMAIGIWVGFCLMSLCVILLIDELWGLSADDLVETASLIVF